MPEVVSGNAMARGCRRSLFLPAALAGVVCMAAPAPAQVADVGGTADVEEPAPAQVWRFTVGLGAAVVPDYAGSDDYTRSPPCRNCARRKALTTPI